MTTFIDSTHSIFRHHFTFSNTKKLHKNILQKIVFSVSISPMTKHQSNTNQNISPKTPPTPSHDDHHDGHSHYLIPFLLILIFAIVELFGSWWTGSLALFSDAGHMFSDVTALGLAWLAGVLAKKPNAARHTSGVSYAELAVSIINAITMLAVSVYVVVEAIIRFKHPQPVQGLGVVLLASIGFGVNVIVAKQLHHQAHHHGDSLNNRAAFLHVLGDLAGSAAAVLAGVVIYVTGWMPIDPILSVLISLLILVPTIKLMRDIWETLQHNKALPHEYDLDEDDHEHDEHDHDH